jgi:hypothetical protein
MEQYTNDGLLPLQSSIQFIFLNYGYREIHIKQQVHCLQFNRRIVSHRN